MCISYSKVVEFEYYASIKTFKWTGAVCWWRKGSRFRDFKWKKKKTLEINQLCPFTSEMSKLGFREGKWVPVCRGTTTQAPLLSFGYTQSHRRLVSPGHLSTRTNAVLKWWQREKEKMTHKGWVLSGWLLGQTPDPEATQVDLIFSDDIQTIPGSSFLKLQSVTVLRSSETLFKQGDHILGALSN